MTDRETMQSAIDAYDWSTVEGVVCTDYAHAAQSLFGGTVCGFYDEDNPGTEPGKLCGGHDFLCVDGRYIIDVWLREVAGMSKQVIFDMQSEADKNSISNFYGDMSKWSVVSWGIA